MAYADVEAVRVRHEGIAGFPRVLRDVWDRYHIPIALTEVHLGCTRAEQLRWLADGWMAAVDARAQGVDVRGLTMWSAFGALDWSSLVTTERGDYEPGIYDVHTGAAHPTALAVMARELMRGAPLGSDHYALAHSGWWSCSGRFCYPPCTDAEMDQVHAEGAR